MISISVTIDSGLHPSPYTDAYDNFGPNIKQQQPTFATPDQMITDLIFPEDTEMKAEYNQGNKDNCMNHSKKVSHLSIYRLCQSFMYVGECTQYWIRQPPGYEYQHCQ